MSEKGVFLGENYAKKPRILFTFEVNLKKV